VKGDRGCSEKQEISIARWRCPVREGGVVHEGGKNRFYQHGKGGI